MPTIAEQFLKAEQAADALVDELTSLKKETQHYRDAAATLDATGRHLGDLAARTAGLAERVGEVVESLREIGTQHFLEKLDTLSACSTAQGKGLDAIQQRLRAAADTAELDRRAIESAIVGVRAEVDGQARTSQQWLQKVENAVAEIGTKVEEQQTGFNTRLQNMENRARFFAYVATGTAIAAAVSSLATLLFVYLQGG
jgi:chromosome segregation ATPase